MGQIIPQPKQPIEEIRYEVDFTKALAESDSVASITSIKVYDAAGTDVTSTMKDAGSDQLNGNKASAMIIAGIDGQRYKITYIVATVDGETLEEDLALTVIAQ
jgi:hypothetical protein